MKKEHLAYYYLMFSAGYIFGRVSSFGRELIGAIIDLLSMTMQFVIMGFLAYVVFISLRRAKKRDFDEK